VLVAALLGRWALRVVAPGEPQRSLIGLESLSLGIAGKASLWRALREIAPADGHLSEIDRRSYDPSASCRRPIDAVGGGMRVL
jgi:hypothetical protein